MEFQYIMLGRLQSDCLYFLGNGNRNLKHLYYDSVEEHIEEMVKIWNNLPEKPEWLSLEEIKDVLQKHGFKE